MDIPEKGMCLLLGRIADYVKDIIEGKDKEIERLKKELEDTKEQHKKELAECEEKYQIQLDECKDQLEDCQDERNELNDYIEKSEKEIKEKFPKGAPQLHMVALVNFSNSMEVIDRDDKNFKAKRAKFSKGIQIVRRLPRTYRDHINKKIKPYGWKVEYEKGCFIETQSLSSVAGEICNHNFPSSEFWLYSNRIYMTDAIYDKFMPLMKQKIDSFVSEEDKESK